MSDKNSHLIFLIQSFEQPRILKIIIDKSKEYKNIYVYGFDRKIHSVENYRILDAYDNIKYEIVGTMEDKRYWNRFFQYLKLLRIIYKKHGFSKKRFYVVGIDLRMLCVPVINKHVDYAISDIAWLYFPKPYKALVGFIDKMLAKFSDKVLFTSMGFYEAHYKNYVSKKQLVLTENKLATYGRVFPIDKLKDDKVRIAYVGAFRYKDIISNLLNVVKNNNDLVLNFYGDGFSDIVEKMKNHAEEYDNITFNGAFKNPDDLQKIYEENNINFVVYNNRFENERVAMPNKFYESGFFNVPIVCATNTYVGKRALELGMGWTTDITQESIQEFFDSMDVKQIIDCHNRIKLLDKSLFNY